MGLALVLTLAVSVRRRRRARRRRIHRGLCRRDPAARILPGRALAARSARGHHDRRRRPREGRPAAVLAQLERIPGVARVEVRPVGAPPPAVEPPPAARHADGLRSPTRFPPRRRPLQAADRRPALAALLGHLAALLRRSAVQGRRRLHLRRKLRHLSRQAGPDLVGDRRPGGRLLALRHGGPLLRPGERRLHDRGPVELPVRGPLDAAPRLPSEQPSGRRVPAPDQHPTHQPQLPERRLQGLLRVSTPCSACTPAAAFSSARSPRASIRGRSSTAWSSRAPGRPARRAGGRSPPSTSSTTSRTTGAPTSRPAPASRSTGCCSPGSSCSCSNTSTVIRRTGSSTRTGCSTSASALTSTSDPFPG